MPLRDGERQVAPDVSGIRRDHVARYQFAARQLALGGSRVIDLACGVGYGAAILAAFGHHVLAIDRSADAIAYGEEHYSSSGRVMFLRQDAADNIAFTQKYDAAICFETIEHVEDPLPMLRALCKASPRLIASVPNEEVFPHRGQIKFHFRHYTRAQFEELLRQAGYRVTAWYGQEGPHSEVEPNMNGRTLIAVAEADVASPRLQLLSPGEKPLLHAQGINPTNLASSGALRNLAETLLQYQGLPCAAASFEKPVPRHVAIVGLGPSCAQFFELTRRLGGVSAYCDEVWGINAIGDVLRCDRVFHMDDLAVQERRAEAKPDTNIAAMVRWLKSHPGPIYTSVVREGYPGLVAFPLEEVLNRTKDTNGGAPYFNSTAAYAVAYAVHIGVKRISLFGIDYTLPDSHRGEKGRACVEFWLGVAAARGVQLAIPDASTLLDACAPEEERLYGYDGVDVTLRNRDDGTVAVTMTPKALPTAAEIEHRYDHTRHPNRLVEQGKG